MVAAAKLERAAAGVLSSLALRTRLRAAWLRHHRVPLPQLLPARPVRALDLTFTSPVLLAAGFDMHGALLEAAAALGLGAIENGSFTCFDGPVPPVLRRWPRVRAPKRGVSLRPPPGPLDVARRNLLRWLATVHGHADYIVLNPGSHRSAADAIVDLSGSMAERLASLSCKPPALVVKLSADGLSSMELSRHARRLFDSGARGLLLSTESSSAVVDTLATVAAACPQATLISVGGVRTATQIDERLAAGAHLVQIHRALSGDPLRACRRLRG